MEVVHGEASRLAVYLRGLAGRATRTLNAATPRFLERN